MKFENKILIDFYNCCDVPVKLVDKEFNDLYKVGYNEYLDSIYYFYEIKDKAQKCNIDDFSYHLELNNDINFKVINMYKYNKKNRYFIIGPFRTSDVHNLMNDKIIYKSYSSSNYLCKLILTIYEDKLKEHYQNKITNPYVYKAIEYVHAHYSENICIDDLCNYLDINKSYFCSLFKKCTGNTFSHFLNKFRVEKSKKLLTTTNLNLLEISICVGFNNQAYYSMIFKKFANQTPLQYRYSVV